MKNFSNFLRRFRREDRGSLIVETAFTLSLIASLTLAGMEVARYALLHQKLERIAGSSGDLIGQEQILSETDVTNVFDAIVQIARPFSMGSDGLVIISSISYVEGGPPVMNWQRTGGGGLTAASKIGTPGGNPTMPTGFALIPGETVITSEVFYNFTPWMFPDVVNTGQLYKSAYFRPRLTTLTSVVP
jgi:Flp pilus assembly protein TadG